MTDLHNCPNCGAPIQADVCPYCGTVFYDFASIDMDAPCYVKLKVNGNIIQARVYVSALDVSTHPVIMSGRTITGEMVHARAYDPAATIDISLNVLGDIKYIDRDKI